MIAAGSPAMAASSAAAADMTAAARTAQAAKPSPLGSADAEFRQLFASWESLDNGTGQPVLARTAISIPSRMPVEGTRLSSGYGMRNHPVIGGRRAHKGVDLAGPTGTPVYATADGLVSKAERFSSYGLFISLEHGADLQTRYAHLSRLNVASGQHVHKGDLIGYIGTTGRSTGPHLHYEVRVHGEAVNPIPYMVDTPAQQALLDTVVDGGQGDGDEDHE